MKYFKFLSLFFLSSVFFTFILNGQETPPIEMPLFLESIRKLQPYMISEEAFKNVNNEKKIQEELDKLKKISKTLTHEKRISQPGTKDAALRVQMHFDELADVFKTSKSYSRFLLVATLNGCSSCHTQVKGSEKPLFYFDPKDLSGTSLQKGEFLFAIRQYPLALEQYKKVLNEDNVLDQRVKALERGLIIHLRNMNNLEAAEKWITLFNKKYKDSVDVSDPYQKDLKKLKTGQIPNPKTASVEELKNFAENNCMPNSRFINRVVSSGVLYDHLEQQRKKNASVDPVIYYWIGKCDSSLQNASIFSLTNLMFEHCIELSKQSVLAKKCFEEIEIQTIEDFTGSSGSHLPPDQISKLNALRKSAGLQPKTYSEFKD